MIDKKIEGFVIKKTNYKESDAIFNVLTKDSMISFNARGINKANSKNMASCNYFTISEFNLTSKSELTNNTLKNASIIKMYHSPYESMGIMLAFMFALNVAYQVYESVNTYDLCIEVFDKLEKKESIINVLVYFLKNLVNKLGYNSVYQGCVNCNAKRNLISFSLVDGGFICTNCFKENEHEKFSNEYLKDIYLLYKDNNYQDIIDTRALKMFNEYIKFLKDNVGLYFDNLNLLLQSI